jgi:hypothetical protein
MLYAISVLVLLVCYLLYVIKDIKDDNFVLMKLNNVLNDDLNGYKSKQSVMFSKIKELESLSEESKAQIEELMSQKEIFKFVVESKVKWLDKTGQEEFGIVCDDFFSDGKHFVVIRAIKKDKITNRYHTIAAERVVVI